MVVSWKRFILTWIYGNNMRNCTIAIMETGVLVMLRRSIPTQRQLKTRKAILESYCDLTPIEGECLGLEGGNKKTGISNSKNQTVMVWNLPPVITCPGADGCLHYCYNADTRVDVFPIERWCCNLYWVTEKRDELICKLNEQMNKTANPVVRLHSSGDFFSNEYIDLWEEVVDQHPLAFFWGYTRSWRIPELLKSLERLRARPNVQLIASLDEGDIPPKGWRFCIVGEEPYREGMFNCPEQYIGGPNCLDCGICFHDERSNIYFAKH